MFLRNFKFIYRSSELFPRSSELVFDAPNTLYTALNLLHGVLNLLRNDLNLLLCTFWSSAMFLRIIKVVSWSAEVFPRRSVVFPRCTDFAPQSSKFCFWYLYRAPRSYSNLRKLLYTKFWALLKLG